MKKFVITIDGPSGVGKTTIGKTISERLNLNFFSSGSIYRSVAKYLIENDVAEVDDLDIEILSNRCTVNGISYDEKDLYDQKISIKSSEIAKLQDLRIFQLSPNFPAFKLQTRNPKLFKAYL